MFAAASAYPHWPRSGVSIPVIRIVAPVDTTKVSPSMTRVTRTPVVAVVAAVVLAVLAAGDGASGVAVAVLLVGRGVAVASGTETCAPHPANNTADAMLTIAALMAAA